MRFFFYLIGLAGMMLHACQNQSEQSPSREVEAGQANYSVEQNQPQSKVDHPSAAEIQTLIALQERVVHQPGEISARRDLGEKAINASAKAIWTVGRATLAREAPAGAVARSQAELAARLDASRWAAYLLEWQKNNFATNFGAIQGQIPASEVINTSYTDSSCVVVLKTSLQ